MNDGWYETGSRTPRTSNAVTGVLIGAIYARSGQGKSKYRPQHLECGCVLAGHARIELCPRHAEYVIQEEP